MSKNQNSRWQVNYALRWEVIKCQKLVNKHKNTYHIVYIYGNYFVVTTKNYQQSLKQFCDDKNHEMQLVKTQNYYISGKGSIKPKKFKVQNTHISNLIIDTDKLIIERENIDLTTKQGRLVEKGLRKIIKRNISKIKRKLRGMIKDNA